MAQPAVLQYNCTACREKLNSREEMKSHCGSAFHAYNISRKVQGLPPVDRDTFAHLPQDAEESEDRTIKFHCRLCRKTYASAQTLSAHLRSVKHLEAKRSGEPVPATKKKTCMRCGAAGHFSKACPLRRCKNCGQQGHTAAECPGTPSEAAAGTVPVEGAPQSSAATEVEEQARSCLFCPHRLENAAGCLRHMFQAHWFRLPLWEYVTDEVGLLGYLHRKIAAGICLHCGPFARNFQSVADVRRHMTTVGHDQLNWERDRGEYAEFYTFPVSERWILEPDEQGMALLPDGRKIVSRRAEVGEERRRGGELVPVPAGLTGPHAQRQLWASRVARAQLALSDTQCMRLGTGVVKRMVAERQSVVKDREYHRLKIQVDHNGPMFHGHMV